MGVSKIVDAIRFAVALGRPEIITCVGSGGGSSRLFIEVVKVMEVVVVVVTANRFRFRRTRIRLIARDRCRHGYR